MVFAAKRKNELNAAELIAQLRTLHVAGADLKALIEMTHEFITEDVERRVRELKSGSCGALPAEVLRRDLVKFQCKCVAGLRLLSDE